MPAQISLPETGFVRLKHIIGDPKAGIPPLIPVGSSTWWQGVKTGKYPQPVKLGPRISAWTVESIRFLIDQLAAASAPTDKQSYLGREPGPEPQQKGSRRRQRHRRERAKADPDPGAAAA